MVGHTIRKAEGAVTTRDWIADDDDREAGVAVVYEVDDPEHALMLEVLEGAAAAIKIGDFERAERHLRRGLEHAPDNHQCQAYLAICVAALGRNLREAEQLARRIARDHARDPVGHYALGQIHLLSGQRRSAFRHLERARRLAASDPEMTWQLDGLDPRRQPVLRGLPRNHPLNVLCGRVRAVFKNNDEG
jgi:tetratricopeptide (TPR) repeat protein